MLRSRRKEKHMTMKQLGAIVGVSEGAISQYETGKRQADFETLLKLGDALDCSVDYLLRGTIPPVDKKEPTPETEDGRINLNELDDMTAESIQLLLALPEEKQRDAGSYIRYLATNEDK